MKQVFISNKRKVSLKEVPTPRAIKDWVLVKILAAPIVTIIMNASANPGQRKGDKKLRLNLVFFCR